jgi:N-dimethylarginine dimethylaminohydrolase
MCPAKFFGVTYSINSWMTDNINKVDTALAFKQWQQFREVLHEAGATTKLMTPVQSQPDMVFAANAGAFFPLEHSSDEKVFVVARMKHQAERGVEEENYLKAIRRLAPDYAMLELPRREDIAFEGEGDVVQAGLTTVIGYGPRTNQAGLHEIYKIIPQNRHVLALQLVNPDFYQLDMCFFYHEYNHPHLGLSRRLILAYKDAFTDDDAKRIVKLANERDALLIWVTKEDAYRLACNAVGVDNTIILNNISQAVEEYLQKMWPDEIKIVRIKLTEFLKAGGGAKSLVLEMPQGI